MGREPGDRRIALIPTWRDPDSIGKVLRRFPDGAVDEICVIIDEPTSAVKNEIEGARRETGIPIHVIGNGERRGIGKALKQGMEYALSREYDVVVVLAGNNKDDPAEISKVLNPIVKGGYDYVQGSRFLPGGRHVSSPILRLVFSRVWPFIWTLLTNVRCTDVTNGFRAYKTQLLKDKRIRIGQGWLDGYALEYYLHYKALTLGYETKEVPVTKSYPYRHRGGYSKIFPLRDWWDIVGPLICLKLGVRK